MERILEASSLLKFFGLREDPFSISPDPHFLCATAATKAASEQLVGSIRDRKGLILLSGEVGTGKTLLVRQLLERLALEGTPTALIFNSRVSPDHLLDFILSDFGVPRPSCFKSEKLIALKRWLLERCGAGQTAVLIVDEAQGLPLRSLEEIRLLLNLETPRQKLLQVVLAGQPELEEKLKRHELRQLRQRITTRCKTAPLTLEETQGYIQERLRIGGGRAHIFLPEAAALVHGYSRGIPRLVNVLCEHSLINACAEGWRVVERRFVEQAARDCALEPTDAVSRIAIGSDQPGDIFDEISSMVADVAVPDSAPPTDNDCPEYLAPTEATPIVGDLEIRVAAIDSSAGEILRSVENELSGTSGRPVPLGDTVLTEVPGGGAASSLENSVIVQEESHVSVDLVQMQPLGLSWEVRGERLAGFGNSPAWLFQGWWRSFCADARSTERQLHRLMRGGILRFRQWGGSLTNSFASLRNPALSFAADDRWRKGLLSGAHAAWRKISCSLSVWLRLS